MHGKQSVMKDRAASRYEDQGYLSKAGSSSQKWSLLRLENSGIYS